MSQEECIRVQEAIHVLCEARSELLRFHWTKILAFVRKTEVQLTPDDGAPNKIQTHRNALPPTASDHDQVRGDPVHRQTFMAPPHSDGSSAPASTCEDRPPQPPRQTPIDKLFASLINNLEDIKVALSGECRVAAQREPQWMADDPRIVDLVIAQPDASPVTKFRRGLSQRSLASEFEDWEQGFPQASEAKSRRKGLIPRFLAANKHRFLNDAAAKKGILHGSKLLRCERLFGGIGVSVMLIFYLTQFYKVKLHELPDLKAKILSSDPLKKLAEQKAGWLRQCQRDYDGKELVTSAYSADFATAVCKRKPRANKRRGLAQVAPRSELNQQTNRVASTIGVEAMGKPGTSKKNCFGTPEVC